MDYKCFCMKKFINLKNVFFQMRLNILVSGKGGQGVNECASILGSTLTSLGYYCFMYRDYESRIEGGHIFNILTVSDDSIQSCDWSIDIFVAMHMHSISFHKKNVVKQGVILTSESLKYDSYLEKQSFQPKAGNMFYAAAVLKVLGVGKEALIDTIGKSFKPGPMVEENKKAVELGYGLPKQGNLLGKMKKTKEKLYFFQGSDGIGMGAIASGLDVYLGYPMTPSTVLMHYLIEKQIQENIFVYYMDSEVSAINAALGASYTGAKVMTGTSGGGYDLMTEGVSFQGMAEIPLVIMLGQRAGPATGLPTFAMQADLHLALKSSHGEFPRVVVAPSTSEDAISLTNQAFYLAHKWRIVSIVLADKNTLENKYTITTLPKIIPVVSSLSSVAKKALFDNYKITPSGTSPMGVPGKVLVKASSHEHDESGLTIEDAASAKAMFDKRMRKIQGIEKDISKFPMVKLYGNPRGKKLVITWGSNLGAWVDLARENKTLKIMQILYMQPFPSLIVKKEIKKASKVYVSELNYTGQLADLIAEKTGILISAKQRILKYDGRPFTPSEIKKRLK